jgi:negative modulator of initiation of replication
MMRTIQIEDHVYDLLQVVPKKNGVSDSEIIWKLLTEAIKVQLPRANPTGAVGVLASHIASADISLTPLEEFLKSSAFLVHGNVTQRFLAILAWLYKQNRSEFAKVKGLRGTNRLYLSESEHDLEASGNSVNPRRVPDTPYWVVTNSPTQGKKKLLSDVMRVLGYDLPSIHTAAEALD